MDQESRPSLSSDKKHVQHQLSPAVQELVTKFESAGSVEEKIQGCLEFMQHTLGGKTPHFKDYWDAKRVCLAFFKAAIPPHVRSELWGRYIELSTQVRRLKHILEEQSAFAVEQIDLAIQAIEVEVQKLDSLMPEFTAAFALEKAGEERYQGFQKIVAFFNALADRTTALRKEVMKTEMRLRLKAKFFHRLTKAGDRIFPARKEFAQKISQQFLQDVMRFSKENFTPDKLAKGESFALREEIKMFQSVARGLMLNTETFSKVRFELSECWNLLDKKQQEDQEGQKEIHQKNRSLVMDKIRPYAERCRQEGFKAEDALKQAKEILNFMKTLDLNRDEVRTLKEELEKAGAPVRDRIARQEEARKKEIAEYEQQKHQKIEQFKRRIEEVLTKARETPFEELVHLKNGFDQELKTLTTSHAQKEILEHELKRLRDFILNKKEEGMARLTQEQKQSLDHLYQFLEEWKEQRKEILRQREVYRQMLSRSGFNVEQALHYQELRDAENARLDKVNQAIEELEEQIDTLEGA